MVYKIFTKVWLIAMVLAGLVTVGVAESWMVWISVMLFVGASTMGIFLLIWWLMPWITRE
jgi:hypothetical protein